MAAVLGTIGMVIVHCCSSPKSAPSLASCSSPRLSHTPAIRRQPASLSSGGRESTGGTLQRSPSPNTRRCSLIMPVAVPAVRQHGRPAVSRMNRAPSTPAAFCTPSAAHLQPPPASPTKKVMPFALCLIGYVIGYVTDLFSSISSFPCCLSMLWETLSSFLVFLPKIIRL